MVSRLLDYYAEHRWILALIGVGATAVGIFLPVAFHARVTQGVLIGLSALTITLVLDVILRLEGEKPKHIMVELPTLDDALDRVRQIRKEAKVEILASWLFPDYDYDDGPDSLKSYFEQEKKISTRVKIKRLVNPIDLRPNDLDNHFKEHWTRLTIPPASCSYFLIGTKFCGFEMFIKDEEEVVVFTRHKKKINRGFYSNDPNIVDSYVNLHQYLESKGVTFHYHQAHSQDDNIKDFITEVRKL